MNKEKKQGIINFIKEINEDIQVEFQEYDMECDIFEETVYIGKTYDKRTDKWFLDFVHELEPRCSANIFLLSILHEIGHIMTYEEENLEEKDIIYGLLKIEHQENKNDEEMSKNYFRIPLEKEATLWGIQYAMSHPEIMEKYAWLGED